MVTKMNKRGFIKKIQSELNCDLSYATMVNDVMEEYFIIGKKNKEKTIDELEKTLQIEYTEAEHIYEVCSNIIKTAIKDKIKHPFRSNE